MNNGFAALRGPNVCSTASGKLTNTANRPQARPNAIRKNGVRARVGMDGGRMEGSGVLVGSFTQRWQIAMTTIKASTASAFAGPDPVLVDTRAGLTAKRSPPRRRARFLRHASRLGSATLPASIRRDLQGPRRIWPSRPVRRRTIRADDAPVACNPRRHPFGSRTEALRSMPGASSRYVPACETWVRRLGAERVVARRWPGSGSATRARAWPGRRCRWRTQQPEQNPCQG